MLCPVCKTECGTETVCKECGFDQIQVEFLNREEATLWMETVVVPYREKWQSNQTEIVDLKNIDFVEYANNKTKSSGIFNQNGKLKRNQIADVRKQLRETKSIIWSAVISFEENFGLKWCNTFDQAQNILQSELPKFFKKAGLKADNMEWMKTQTTDIFILYFLRKNLSE